MLRSRSPGLLHAPGIRLICIGQPVQTRRPPRDHSPFAASRTVRDCSIGLRYEQSQMPGAPASRPISSPRPGHYRVVQGAPVYPAGLGSVAPAEPSIAIKAHCDEHINKRRRQVSYISMSAIKAHARNRKHVSRASANLHLQQLLFGRPLGTQPAQPDHPAMGDQAEDLLAGVARTHRSAILLMVRAELRKSANGSPTGGVQPLGCTQGRQGILRDPRLCT